MEKKTDMTPISSREKFVIIIALFLIKMVRPWEYDHQFTGFWDEVKKTIDDSKE